MRRRHIRDKRKRKKKKRTTIDGDGKGKKTERENEDVKKMEMLLQRNPQTIFGIFYAEIHYDDIPTLHFLSVHLHFGGHTMYEKNISIFFIHLHFVYKFSSSTWEKQKDQKKLFLLFLVSLFSPFFHF